MPIIHHPGCSTPSFFKPCAPFSNYRNNLSTITPFVKHSKSRLISFERLYFASKLEKVRRARVRLCAENGVLGEVGDTILPRERVSEESEELELLNKPSPKIVDDGPVVEVVENEQKKADRDEVLEPFYKFFKPFEEEIDPRDIGNESSIEESIKVSVECYEPKRGDLVVGVVVSGNESKLDVSVGADLLGTMLTKEVLPLYDKEMDHLLWDAERDAELLVRGKMGIVKNDEALSGEPMPGKPVVELGTVLFAEVLGRTLGGRPLLSTRRLFRRIAWHRVRLNNLTSH